MSGGGVHCRWESLLHVWDSVAIYLQRDLVNGYPVYLQERMGERDGLQLVTHWLPSNGWFVCCNFMESLQERRYSHLMQHRWKACVPASLACSYVSWTARCIYLPTNTTLVTDLWQCPETGPVCGSLCCLFDAHIGENCLPSDAWSTCKEMDEGGAERWFFILSSLPGKRRPY